MIATSLWLIWLSYHIVSYRPLYIFQVIPALSAFCAYAALGILGLYLLVSTFFVAILTLDEYRIKQNRNSVIFCYKHKNYSPTECSKKELVALFIKNIYAPTLMKLSCKVSFYSCCYLFKIIKIMYHLHA
jgi:hypothetical protein